MAFGLLRGNGSLAAELVQVAGLGALLIRRTLLHSQGACRVDCCSVVPATARHGVDRPFPSSTQRGPLKLPLFIVVVAAGVQGPAAAALRRSGGPCRRELFSSCKDLRAFGFASWGFSESGLHTIKEFE